MHQFPINIEWQQYAYIYYTCDKEKHSLWKTNQLYWKHGLITKDENELILCLFR